MERSTLRRRLYLLFLQWFFLFLLLAGAVSWYSLQRFRHGVFEDRLLLARTIASYLDSTLSESLRSLGRVTDQIRSLDQDTLVTLRSLRFQSPFREAIYVVDEDGRPVLADPPYATPLDAACLPDHVAITRLCGRPGGDERPLLAAVQPFRLGGKGHTLVAEMNPLGSTVSTFLQGLTADPRLHIAVIDASATVIAAADRKYLFQHLHDAAILSERIEANRVLQRESETCLMCDPGRDRDGSLAVLVPLRFAPWGVLVEQHRDRAFAALRALQWGFLLSGALLVLTGLFLARALSRSVIAPIQSLSAQAERLRQGDLEHPIAAPGDREVEVLAATLDEARRRLASTLGELRTLNEQLEAQVAARTRTLESQYRNLRLLHDISQLAATEPEPERFLPETLERVSEHHAFPAAAVVRIPSHGAPSIHTWPPGPPLAWVGAGAAPPDGWHRHDLDHHGRCWGHFFHPVVAEVDDRVIAALQHQLALTLHGTDLVQQLRLQDGQRQVLVRRLLDAGEEERRRLARELHDETSQLLTAIALALERIGGASPELGKARQLLGRTQQEIHRIILDLRPTLLDDLGLAAAIQWYAANLERQGLKVNLEVDEGLRLPPEVEIATFRIYQEIVTNILRHARAENVSIELYRDDDRMVLGVEDDGVGFSPDAKVAGAGLVGMRERATLVGGTLTIDSEPGMGSHVRLDVPLRP